MYGTYFFLGEILDEYSYEADNFISMLSGVGGLIEFLYIAFGIIPFLYNTKFAQNKFIDKLYFIDRANLGFKRMSSNVERLDQVSLN